ncbi:MAG: hypothetical protein C6W56_02390 [Caldibacillus debilis]|nr:hypothetical protein [Bacillaceae bacterium]REJ30808.1 MAG: hypothetical protein C6W56_02390 [Caldibacillus debilis]
MILPAAAESLSDFCANFPSVGRKVPPAGRKIPGKSADRWAAVYSSGGLRGRARALQVVSMV